MKNPVLLLCLLITTTQANPDLFPEQLADPETRAAALATLTPGTRDHFFHTALDHQLNNRTEAFRKTLTEWKAAATRPEIPISNQGLETLENRQLLLDHETDHKASLTELTRRLRLTFDHAKPDSAAAAEDLPTTLDPALITADAFLK